MIRIFFNPLDAKSKVEYPVTEGTQLIHFLQEHYPNGFDGMLRVFVGIDELDLADLDYEVQKHDQITMLVMPSGVTWVAVGKILVTALVTAAVSYAINLIFAPKTPSFGDDADESPVYSLNPTRNSARLGQPIAVSYGRVSWPPAFASAPYGFYFEGTNDQYIDELLCLGHGKFNIEEIYIGDTPLSAFESGTVRYWVFDQDVHQQQMGRVGDYITQSLANTDNNFPFYENVFTSPEVEGQEFYENKNEPNSTPAAISGNAYAGSIDPVTGFYIQGRIEDVDNSVGIAGGDTITLAGTANNNGTFVVKSVTQTEPGFMTIFESASLVTPFIVDEQPLNGTFTIPSTVDGMTFGPYRCQKVGTKVNRVDCDIIFPQGLFYVDSTSGNTKSLSVEMEFTYQQIDEETGAPIGLAIVQTKEWTAATRVALRATVTSGELDEGAYECTVRRVNPVDDGGEATDLVTWAGLKGYITFDRNKRAYGPVSLIAFRLKATNGIAAAARSRIRVVATRIIDGIESDNPISVIKDIWTNHEYGLGFPASQLDPNLDSLETFWGDPLGPKFNGSFDQKSTGYDGIQTVASLAGAKAVNNGQLLDVVPDGLQDVRSALFTTANIVRDSLEIFYTFDAIGEFTGNVVEWRDPETFDSRYVYAPVQTDNPEAFTLFGCTDEDYAQRMANYLWNVKANRRKAIRFDTELEGLIPRFGQRIGVSHTMPDWGQSGVFVQQIDAVTWMVDQPLDWTEDNVIIIRSDTGLPSSPYTVTKGTGDNIVVFGEVPPIHDQQGLDPTSYAFGTAENNIIDAIVTKISPKGENIVTIESQVYSEDVYVDAPWQMNPFDPPEITPLAAGGLTWDGFGYKNLILLDGEGKIMWNHRGYGPVQKSIDDGQTWASVSFRQQNAGEKLVFWHYNDTIDRTYVFPYYNTGRQIRSEYSNNFYDTAGIVWNPTNTAYGNGLPNSYTHGPLMIGEEMYHLNAESIGGAARIIKHTQIGVVGNEIADSAGYTFEPAAGAVPISTGDLSSWGTVDVGNKIFITYSGQGQPIQYGMIMDKLNLSTIDFGKIVHADNGTESLAWVVDSDGTEARVLTRAVGSVATFSRIDENTIAQPFDTVEYDFGENIMIRANIAYGGGRWLAIAIADADRTKLLLMGDGFTGVRELYLPITMNENKYKQIVWDERNNRWLFSVMSDDIVVNEMYLFAIEKLY